MHRRNAKEANCEPSGIRVKICLNGRYKLLNKYATVASVSVRRGSTGKAAHHADVAVISLSGGVGSALPPRGTHVRDRPILVLLVDAMLVLSCTTTTNESSDTREK